MSLVLLDLILRLGVLQGIMGEQLQKAIQLAESYMQEQQTQQIEAFHQSQFQIIIFGIHRHLYKPQVLSVPLVKSQQR